LAEKVARITGYDVDEVVLVSYPPGYPLRPIVSDQPYLVLNPSKIRRHGWGPKESRGVVEAKGLARDFCVRLRMWFTCIPMDVNGSRGLAWL